MRPIAAALIALVSLEVVGCGAATQTPANPQATSARPSELVKKSPQEVLLTAAELPEGFVLRSETPFQPGNVIRQFERSVSRGPAYVTLVIFLFDDAAAAHAKFEESRRDPASADSVPPPRAVGDEAYVNRFDMPARPGGLPFDSTNLGAMFRYANVVEGISLGGVRDTVTVSDLMEITDRQLAKIRAP
jgi:hypothetical protein